MRTILTILAAIVAAVPAGAGYIPTELGGPIAARGTSDAGLRVSAVVAADGVWPLLAVKSVQGWDHTSTVEVDLGAGYEVVGTTAEMANASSLRLVPEITAVADGTLAVRVGHLFDGAAGLAWQEFADTPVRRGGGSGIAVDAWLPGDGLPPGFSVDVALGYETVLGVYARLATGAGIGHTYQDTAYAQGAAGLAHSLELLVGDQYHAFSGDTLYVMVSLGHADHDTLAFEFVFELQPPPGAPANFSAVAVSGAVELQWDASTAQDVLGYRIFRREQHGGGSLYPVTHQPEDFVVPSPIYNSEFWNDFSYWYDHYNHRWMAMGIGSGSQPVGFYIASSDDHVTWTAHPRLMQSALADSIVGGRAMIGGYYVDRIYAPHVIEAEGKWRMFFSGIEWGPAGQGAGGERAMYAEAELGADLRDPTSWVNARFLHDADCTDCATDLAALEAELAGVEGFGGGINWINPATSWHPTTPYVRQCRDPWVVRDDAIGKWVQVNTVVGGPGYSSGLRLGVSVADSLDGDWTFVGHYLPEGYESPIMVESGGKYFISQLGGAGQRSRVGPTALGPWTAITGSSVYAREPMSVQRVERPDGSYFTGRPLSVATDARMSAIFSLAFQTLSFHNIYASSYGTHATFNQSSPSLAPTFWVWRPMEVIAGTEFVDRSALPGQAYGYAVAAVTASGMTGLSDVADVTAYREAIYTTFMASVNEYANSVEYLFAGTLDDGLAGLRESRYRYVVEQQPGTPPDCATFDFGATSWTSWSPIAPASPLGSTTFAPLPSMVSGDWLVLQVQVRDVSSPNAADIDICWAGPKITALVPPDNFAAAKDGDDVDCTWGAAAEADQGYDRVLVRYEVFRQAFGVEESYTLRSPYLDPGTLSWRDVGFHDVVGASFYAYKAFAVYEQPDPLNPGQTEEVRRESNLGDLVFP